jgi:hypothetical protein
MHVVKPFRRDFQISRLSQNSLPDLIPRTTGISQSEK